MANIWDKLEQQAFEPNKKDEVPSGTSVWDNLEARALGAEPPKRNAFMSGVTSGIDELQGLAYSGGAALADVAGLDKAKDWLDQQAKRNEREAAVNARPELERIEDQTIGSALPYAAYQVGKQVPNILGGIVAGAVVPEAAVPAFLSRGAAALPKFMGGGALGAAEGYAAKKAALQAGETFGKQVVGGAAFNEAQAVGSLYQSAKEGGDEHAGLKALAMSPAYALTETLPEAMLVGRFAHGGFSGNLLSRAAKGFGTQAVTGATSEGLQNEMEMALNPNLTPEQKASSRLNSIAAGGLVEGILGGAGGTLSKSSDRQAGSLLKDTIQTQDIANKPDLNAIDKAINDNSPEMNVAVPKAVLNPNAPESVQNPLGTPNPNPEAQQQSDQAQADLQAAQQQAAQDAQAQAHQAAQQQFNQSASLYGINALPQANQYRMGGKQFFSTTQAQEFIHGLDALNANLGDEMKAMIGATVNSGGIKIDQKATPKTVQNAAVKFLANWGLSDAPGIDAAMDRVNTIIGNIEGPKALKDADILNNFYKSIAGVNAPAFDKLQVAVQPTLTKGASNERIQQLQTNAGLREVPVQRGTNETGGAGVGNVRPTQVQPIGAGGVGARPSGIQAGAISGEGIPTSTSTGGNASNIRNERTGQGQGSLIADERVSAINQIENIAKRAFGERDYQIIMEFIQSDAAVNQSDIARQFGISRQRVNQIVGAAKEGETFGDTIARRAQESWGPRFLLAARNMGVSEAEVRDLFATLAQSQEETSLAAQEAQGKALSEGGTEEALQGKEAQETEHESEEQRTLGIEETSDTEKGAAGYRVFTPGVSGETGIEDTAATNKARFSKKELEKMSDVQLQNLAADENTTPEKLDEIVAELIRRQDIRVNKGNENAVQKQSTGEGNVRKPAENRQEVGEVNAKHEEPAGTRQAQTEEEAAAQAWNEGIKDFPQAPKFEELSKDQQEDWISFGPENWTKEDVQTELVKLAKEPKLLSKSAPTKFFDEIEHEPGFDRIRNYLDITGIPNALDFVSDWATINDPKAEPGSIESMGGRYKITVNVGVGNEAYVGETARHEIGHAVDMAPHGGVYSAQPEMSVVLKDGVLTPVGKVAKELYSLYQNSSRWNEFLAYPFDVKKFTDLNTAVKVELEMFAQAFTIYTDPNAKRLLEREAPITAAYFAEVINDIKSTKALQIQKATTAAERVVGFKNRNTPERSQTAISVVQRRTEEAGTKQLSLSKVRLNTAEQVAKLPKPIRGPLQHIMDNIVDFAKKGVPWAAFTEDLADIASKFIPSAKKYVGLMKERQAIRTKYERNIDLILQQYDKLPSEVKGTGEKSVNRFLKDSTMEGKWAYNPGWIKNFDETKDIDQALKERFDAMPKEAQALIKAVFAQGHESLMAMKKSVTENINTEFDALIAAAKKAGDVEEEADLVKKKQASLTEYATLMRTGSKTPYAPLKRFGNYVVVGRSQAYLDAEKVRDSSSSTPDQVAEANSKLREFEKNEDHYFVQFAETMGEAKAIAREEGSNYALVEPFEKDSARQALFGGKDVQGLFYRLRHMVEESSNSAVSDASERAINRLLSDLHLSLLSDQSARQAERRRRKIAGAEDDMMRAFATQGRANAHFIASLENSESIYDALRQMKDETDARTPGREDRRRYYNEFMKRHAMGLEYQPSPFIDKALSTTSAWMLLTNPAYYLQNLTQPFMMSLPVIGGKHGYTRSWKEMTRAYNDIAGVIKKYGIGEDSYSKLPEDVRQVVEELVNRGRIDISLEQDLGRWRSTEDSKFAKFGEATEKLRSIAQNIETLNRVATAVAAYRLEVKASNPTRALNYADKIIYTTHGDYSGFNAPRITRSTLGRLATQFRKFQLIQLSLMTRLFHDAFAGADKETRQIGRLGLMYTIGHTAVMGGVMGLPGFAVIGMLLSKMFGDDDEPADPELAMRRAIGNDTLADLLVKGVPAALGVDVSGKIGMGQMLSVLPYTDVTLSRKGVYETAGTLLTGPFGGLLAKSADGLSYIGQGDYYKGIEQLLPTGLSNILKGVRVSTEGVTSRTGDVTMSPDEISFLDGFMVALGLPTKTMTDKSFLQNTKYEFDQFYNDRASEVKREYVRAYRAGDGEALSEARQEWAKLQESRARNGYTRQPLSTLIKAPMEQAKRERNTIGGVAVNKANRGFVKQTSEL